MKNFSQLVIYHSHCMDGFAAAWCAFNYAYGDDALYQPSLYGIPPPIFIGDYNYVDILDFSYKKEITEKLLIDYPNTIFTILDHHKSSLFLKELTHYPNLHLLHDLSHSGAMIAFEYYNQEPNKHSSKAHKRVIEYVQDRDLWQWKLKSSREINAAFRTFPMDFIDFDVVTDILDDNFQGLVNKGETIIDYNKSLIDEAMGRVMLVDINGIRVPCVNSCFLWSEIASRLCELYSNYPFAAVYFNRADGLQQWSLRSKNFNLTKLEGQIKIGGHEHAAGFEISINQPLKFYRNFKGKEESDVIDMLRRIKTLGIYIDNEAHIIDLMRDNISSIEYITGFCAVVAIHVNGYCPEVKLDLFVDTDFYDKTECLQIALYANNGVEYDAFRMIQSIDSLTEAYNQQFIDTQHLWIRVCV